MIINPLVKLTYQPPDQTWAKLERLDSKATYDFLVNPQTIQRKYTAAFNKLAVLGTSQPQLSYVNSESILTIPEVLFWTPNNSGDISDTLSALATMTKPLGLVPPLLKLTWGFLREPRLYLESLDITETQWRSGKVTQATGSMSFLIAPEAVTTKTTSEGTKTLLSTKEQEDYRKLVSDRFKKDPALALSLGVSKGSTVEVQDNGSVVTESPQGTFSSIGSLKSILGSVKPGHENL